MFPTPRRLFHCRKRLVKKLLWEKKMVPDTVRTQIKGAHYSTAILRKNPAPNDGIFVRNKLVAQVKVETIGEPVKNEKGK